MSGKPRKAAGLGHPRYNTSMSHRNRSLPGNSPERIPAYFTLRTSPPASVSHLSSFQVEEAPEVGNVGGEAPCRPEWGAAQCHMNSSDADVEPSLDMSFSARTPGRGLAFQA
jgi:hypothetical protein